MTAKFYALDLYRPPKFLKTLGYFGRDDLPVGLWHDLDKITIDFGVGSVTSSNLGWQQFCDSNIDYFVSLYHEYDIYGDNLSGKLPEYGFLILPDTICLGKLIDIKSVVILYSTTEQDI